MRERREEGKEEGRKQERKGGREEAGEGGRKEKKEKSMQLGVSDFWRAVVSLP